MKTLSFGPQDGDVLMSQGPTISVDIGFDPNYHKDGMLLQLQGKSLPALLDTGAALSCIDAKLAIALKLPVVDRSSVSGAGGRFEVNDYLAQIHIPQLSHLIYGKFSGVHLLDGGQQHVALIGRSFLRHCVLVYDGINGAVTIQRM